MSEKISGCSYSALNTEHEVQLDSVILISEEWRGFQSGLLLRSEPVAAAFEPPTYMFTRPDKTFQFDFVASGLIKFVSAELADFLKNRINAEFLPIRASYGKNYDSPKSYQIMHLLDRFDAMDRERSIFSEYDLSMGGGVGRVSLLALNGCKLNNSPAFFLNELAAIFVRDDICADIKEAGFRGLGFTPLKDYRF